MYEIDFISLQKHIFSKMLKYFSRKFSPLTLLLLLLLLLYSFSISKRLKRQQNVPNKRFDKNWNFIEFWNFIKSNIGLDEKVILYVITPTYPRPEQLPELTRLSQTLMVRFYLKKFINFISDQFY